MELEISDLPDEILLKIARNMSPEDLFRFAESSTTHLRVIKDAKLL